MKAQKTAFKVAKSADLKAPRKIETPTHLSVNKIQQAARLRGYVIAPPKLIAALDKEGYEVMVVPSPSRSGFTRFYKAPDVAAWLDKVAPTKTEAAAPSAAVAGATPHMLHELRELRSEVGVLKDAIHALMTSVMESRDHAESVDNLVHDLAAQARERHNTVEAALDEIAGELETLKKAEQDEKVTLDNMLEILTRPTTSADSAPAMGIDSVLDKHDD